LKNQPIIKLFTVLITCSLFIFSFSYFSNIAYGSFVNGSFKEGTSIASVDISGKSSEEATLLLEENINNWKKNTQIKVLFKDRELEIDNTFFSFEIMEVINDIRNGQVNPLIATLDTDNFLKTLASLSNEISIDTINVSRLQTDIQSSAVMLEPGNYTYPIEDYMIQSELLSDVVLGEAIIPIEMDNPFEENLFDYFSTVEVPAHSQVSLLRLLEEKGIKQVATNDISLIATGIYEVILKTNFDIIERNISSELPSYAKLGYEAKVDLNKQIDFVFSNPNENRYLVEISRNDNYLHIYLKGPSLLDSYELAMENELSFKPKIIIQYNPLLGENEIKVKSEGKEGKLVKLVRNISDQKGELLRTETISEDFYAPVHRVEIHGVSSNKDIETEIDYPNPDVEDSQNDDEPSNENEDSTDLENGLEDITDGAIKEDDLWGKTDEPLK
jgi:hypothetical protein